MPTSRGIGDLDPTWLTQLTEEVDNLLEGGDRGIPRPYLRFRSASTALAHDTKENNT
ncbi:MAG: hypothetical protein ACC658_08640 [Acidimicrobiia bacterium]